MFEKDSNSKKIEEHQWTENEKNSGLPERLKPEWGSPTRRNGESFAGMEEKDQLQSLELEQWRIQEEEFRERKSK